MYRTVVKEGPILLNIGPPYVCMCVLCVCVYLIVIFYRQITVASKNSTGDGGEGEERMGGWS